MFSRALFTHRVLTALSHFLSGKKRSVRGAADVTNLLLLFSRWARSLIVLMKKHHRLLASLHRVSDDLIVFGRRAARSARPAAAAGGGGGGGGDIARLLAQQHEGFVIWVWNLTRIFNRKGNKRCVYIFIFVLMICCVPRPSQGSISPVFVFRKSCRVSAFLLLFSRAVAIKWKLRMLLRDTPLSSWDVLCWRGHVTSLETELVW